jgi:L-threonylcarbamoyladenylate synthase
LAKNFVTGNQDSVGLRVPAHPIALSLLREFEKFGGLGVAAPSANMFRAVSPTSSEEVQDEIGKLLGSSDIILDGSQSQVGIESTIIDCTSVFPTILRPGLVTIEMIESITSLKVKLQNNNLLKVSGSFNTHYAPKTKILLDVPALSGQGFLALANVVTPPGAIRISSPKSINEYASVLYASFRLVDKLKLEYLVVITPEGEGLAVAVRDRLKKAAFK